MMPLDLNQLTEAERDAILSVIKRDEDLKQKDGDRVRKLKAEIKQLRLKGVLKDGQDSETTCARCREKFGFFSNKGAICPNCSHKVCDKCQVRDTEKHSFLCILCSKQKELDGMSNTWFYSKFRASKRKPKSKGVLTGTELVKSSITNTPIQEDEPDSGNTLSEEVKRVLSNNNALPGHGAHDEAECSDTQSMECPFPHHLRGVAAEHAAFPQEDDKKLLMELIRGRKASPSHMDAQRVQVRKVRTKKYADSDSSSGSERSSPLLSSRNESMFTHTDSLRSSTISSEGRITMVTDTISDLDYPLSESCQPSPRSMRALSPDNRSPSLSHREMNGGRSRSPSPSTRSQGDPSPVTSDAGGLEEEGSAGASLDNPPPLAANPCVVVLNDGRPASSGDGDSSSDSHVTLVAVEDETKDLQSSHLEANGFLAPPSPARSRADTEDATDSKSVEKEPIRSAESPVPSIAVTCPEKSSLHSEKDDNIDEAFAEQTPENASNLLSPHSMSRESLASFYSDAGDGVHGKIPVSGEIQFALEYNYKLGQFEVHVKSCRDLAPADSKKKRSDPYVKTYLLPDKSKTGKRKTKVKKHSLSPCFDETLKYQLTKSELETRTLWLTVWSYGNFGRNDFLGEVTIPLDYYHFTDTTPRWHKLLERQLPCMETTSQMENPAVSTLAYKGDLEVALKYISPENIPKDKSKKSKESRGELQVMIKGARNLTAVRANGFSDSFCKGYLLPEKSSRVKKKTPVIKKNVNPLWNHNFIFENLPWEDLKDRCLELTVWDHDRLTSNDFLGGVRLSLGTGNSADKEVDWMDSTGKEISIWQRMLDSPNYWIEDTLSLRPSMSGKHHKPR